VFLLNARKAEGATGASKVKRSLLEVYALAICFVALACFTIALGIGLYDIIQIGSPRFTIAAHQFSKHQSNDAFTRDWPKDKVLPSDEEREKRRLESYRIALQVEQRDGVQGLTKVVLVVLIDVIVFLIHWRIARRERLVTTNG
jgi:hypothetical protein